MDAMNMNHQGFLDICRKNDASKIKNELDELENNFCLAIYYCHDDIKLEMLEEFLNFSIKGDMNKDYKIGATAFRNLGIRGDSDAMKMAILNIRFTLRRGWNIVTDETKGVLYCYKFNPDRLKLFAANSNAFNNRLDVIKKYYNLNLTQLFLIASKYQSYKVIDYIINKRSSEEYSWHYDGRVGYAILRNGHHNLTEKQIKENKSHDCHVGSYREMNFIYISDDGTFDKDYLDSLIG